MLKKDNTHTITLFLFNENRKSVFFNVLGSIIYGIIDKYFSIKYLCTQQDRLSSNVRSLKDSPSLAHCRAKVSRHHSPPWYEHVTLLTPGVGNMILVEDYNSVLHIPVHEMQLDVGVAGCTPWTSLNQATNGHFSPRKCHPLLPWSQKR